MKVFEFHDIKYYVGQNAKENWELLDKAKEKNPDYIWFHLNSFPSPYVIMWSSIKNLEELIQYSQDITGETEKFDNPDILVNITINDYIKYGANLCKEYSKYNYLNDIKIMYTTVKKITKTDKVGELDIKGKSNIVKL